jgi:hypothetical protein
LALYWSYSSLKSSQVSPFQWSLIHFELILV